MITHNTMDLIVPTPIILDNSYNECLVVVEGLFHNQIDHVFGRQFQWNMRLIP